jgi:predicted glycosyltransferase
VDEIDDDLDSPEEDQPAETVDTGPTLADLKKLRSENKGLRTRLKEAQDQALTARFKSDVLEMIPEEVTDFDRRVTLAEQFSAKFAASGEAQTDQATEEAPAEESSPEEEALAAVGKGPSGATSLGGLTQEDLISLAISDPAKYAQLRDSGTASLERLPGSNR